jgi:hypothetical protein
MLPAYLHVQHMSIKAIRATYAGTRAFFTKTVLSHLFWVHVTWYIWHSATINVGLNTLLFSASAMPVSDIIALAATLNNDGIVNFPGTNGTGAFAVAAVNVVATETITASAGTGVQHSVRPTQTLASAFPRLAAMSRRRQCQRDTDV